jgi:hypothetical protein
MTKPSRARAGQARFTRPEVVSYIIECYAGVDTIPGMKKSRRVFLWYLPNGEVHMGNIEAFTIHVGEKFGFIDVRPSDASNIHRILRELGERIQIHSPHSAKKRTNTGQSWPEPEEWVVSGPPPKEEAE